MERDRGTGTDKIKILIIEDEKPIADILQYDLQGEGFRVRCAYTGAQGKQAAEEFAPHLILLDWMLPDISGVDLLKILTEQYGIPVIMLTARGTVEDKVYGMSQGADDYITKPFDLREVNVRIRTVLRRLGKAGEPERKLLRMGQILICEEERTVTRQGEPIELTPREFDLLLWLVRHPRQVFTRDRLLDAVWGFDYTGDTRTVDIHVQRLRKKLCAEEYIVTVFGVGYKYVPE